MIWQEYNDYDCAGSTVDRKSTFGCCFTLGSSMVSYCSRKQTYVDLRTTEAEYIALSMSVREAVWLRKLLAYLSKHVLDSTISHYGNQSCVKILDNLVFHDKSNHIEIKYHYIRAMVQRKEVLVLYLPTDEQVADILTKPGRSSSTSMTDLAWQRMPPSLRGSVDVCSFLRHSPDRTPL
jgi:hypothetical protein